MMKRFDFESDNDDEEFSEIDDDMEDDELNADYIRVLEKRELVQAIRLQLLQKEINHSILNKTIKYLEKSLFWRFKSAQRKLDLIVDTYQNFKALVDIDTFVDEEGEEEIASL